MPPEDGHAFNLTPRTLCVGSSDIIEKRTGAEGPPRGLTLRDGRQGPGHASNPTGLSKFQIYNLTKTGKFSKYFSLLLGKKNIFVFLDELDDFKKWKKNLKKKS